MQRMFTMFHETFALSRPAIAQVLKVVSKYGKNNSVSIRTLLREHTDLGTNYCKAMPRYTYACGLTNDECTQLTPLGERVLQNDPTLAWGETQWLLHYHLSAPEGPGPLFWHRLVTEFLQQHETFTAQAVAEFIGAVVESAENRTLQPRSARATATVFLGSYTKPSALETLHILWHDKKTDTWHFRVPEPPSWAVVGYALMQHWNACYPGQKTISLSNLIEDGFASVFWMGERSLLSALNQLREAGYIDLYLTAPPYQVVRLREDSDDLLEGVYGGAYTQATG
jgi:hypothetical protein